jgi:hypothetical protein
MQQATKHEHGQLEVATMFVSYIANMMNARRCHEKIVTCHARNHADHQWKLRYRTVIQVAGFAEIKEQLNST